MPLLDSPWSESDGTPSLSPHKPLVSHDHSQPNLFDLSPPSCLWRESVSSHIVSSIFSDALSSPIREKTKEYCTGVSLNFWTGMGE
ncbi:hypothetical protein TNCV_3683961 [Trichonephila clavipes]|nr:hypothetical protein TNCV_3683961 [Trichonephila clavipes]